jgi:hypothetical protein
LVRTAEETGSFKTRTEFAAGLFVDRDAALRFVRSENGYRPRAVVMVSEGLELDMSRNSGALPHRELATDLQRRIA